jgi:hypothetical protein
MTPDEKRLAQAVALVNVQAEDAGLWRMTETAPEAYLQAALRELHYVIEGQRPEAPVAARPSPGPDDTRGQ